MLLTCIDPLPFSPSLLINKLKVDNVGTYACIVDLNTFELFCRCISSHASICITEKYELCSDIMYDLNAFIFPLN